LLLIAVSNAPPLRYSSCMTLALFEDDDPTPPAAAPKQNGVRPATLSPELTELAQQLPPQLRLGTSSWYFPGWAGIVWDQPYAEKELSKQGLAAYSQHPLLRTVSLDRAFYRPMTAAQYAQLAAQVSDDFRFVVKVPSVISDALVRETEGDQAGRGLRPNPHFLNADIMRSACIEPLLQGLGHKLGAVVLQMSPLPAAMLHPAQISELFGLLPGIFSSFSAIKNVAPHALMAIELRNPELVLGAPQRELVALLKDTGVTYCLGGHAKMPPLEEQLPILRQLWPGPLVARWNLHSKHGRFGYETAKAQYAPFDQLVDEDPATREVLARVIAGTVKNGQLALVTVNNKAEGSAPLSVIKLAQAVAELLA
jgi:uncharacterized protein YecE (DUF72 family)